ncbi:MAG: phenylalanine--tRNA ligase subunit beta-related protein, partial [Vulcanimicrobiaceae bacterium]
VDVASDRLQVVPPSWRRDLTITADLVEEVARMEGYENIEPIVPSIPAHDISSAQFDLEERIADILAMLGYHEVLTYSLHGSAPFEKLRRAGIEPSHTPIEVRNPLSEDQRYLRYALGPALIAYMARLGRPVRVFEIGHIFTNDTGTISETPVLAFGFAAAASNEPHWRDNNFLRLKGDCEALLRRVTGRTPELARDVRTGLHPGKTGVFLIDGHEVANMGRIDPRLERSYESRLPLYFCNIYLDQLPDFVAQTYRIPSKFPSTYRDLALVLDPQVAAARVETVIARAVGNLATGVRVFDEYRGAQIAADKKSLAVRVTLQRSDTTITDEEADTAIARALLALRDELGAVIRE